MGISHPFLLVYLVLMLTYGFVLIGNQEGIGMDYMDSFVYLFYLLILNVIKPIMFFIISRKILLFCIFFIGMVILRLRCLIFSFFLSILNLKRVVLFSIFLFQLLHQQSCMFLHHFENLLSRFPPRFSHPQNDRCPYLTLNRLQIILHIL